VTVDPYELRRKASLQIGVDDSLDPELVSNMNDTVNTPNNTINTSIIQTSTPATHSPYQFAYAQNKFDLTFELSGSPSALNDAIALTAFSGRIVIGSWYGEKRAEINLGGVFHRSRIKLISSQVSTIAPELSGKWDKARRFDVAWKALERIKPEKWITHRFPIERAEEAYRLLDENPQEVIQVIFEYKS
jgi:threonine dehydrogenase-like Zn-dependent dehydrogenase